MSRIVPRVTKWLAISAALGTTALAQQPRRTELAPVPRQLLTAKAAFIGNGGGESYGGESYYHLTTYDGGPNRAYDSFYKEVRDWGHYELVGSTSDADVMLVIRFTNPVVDRNNNATAGDVSHEWIYDPQLNLSINDPKTGLPLWAITEHIEPADDRAAANKHFDEAVTRLVDDLQRLILHPDESLARQSEAVPPGAVMAAQREQREKHAAFGFLVGGLTGAAVGLETLSSRCGGFGNDFNECVSRSRQQARNAMIGFVGGMIAGALVGWVWPVGP